MAKTKRKRGAELPSPIPAFIESVTSTPLENIEAPLSTFTWTFEKGDLYHWVDLFNHFESFFEKFIKPRRDLQLDGDFVDVDEPLPVSSILEILRLSRIILENCNNKHAYTQIEHLSLLLAATNADVTVAALETLAAFVKKPLQSARALRWHGEAGLNSRLFSLSQGWGGKEEGLGLLACAEEGRIDASTQRLGCMLHFEFYSERDAQKAHCQVSNNEQPAGAGLHVIHVPDVHLRPESDLQLLKSLVDQHAVPKDLRFSLLTRLRFARAFASLEGRRQFIRIRLLAFTVLLQSNPIHEDLAAFFANEPEFIGELVSVARAEDSVPEDIRTLAILALAAQAQDRQRQQQVMMVMGAGGHRGILPSLIQKAVTCLQSGKPSCSVHFVEALLCLVSALVSSASGGNALREAGLVPTLLPLMKDHDPQHLHIVCGAVHILENFMDHINTAPTLFRDLGGLEDTVDRLWVEVSKVEAAAREEMEEGQLAKGKVPAVDEDVRPAVTQGKGSATYIQRQLIKALLRAIALANYAPGSNGRLQEDSRLPACLCVIFRHARAFGGGVFATAAQVMSDLIHNDPTCYAALDAAGLPGAFLDTIGAGILPSSEAICCIPSALNALCLNHTGLQAVQDRDSLSTLVPVFTLKSYQKAMAGDTPQSLGQSLEELMRHVPVLRPAGVAMVVRMLKTIAVLGGAGESTMPPPFAGGAGTSGSSGQGASSSSPISATAGVGGSSMDSIMTEAVAGTTVPVVGSQDGTDGIEENVDVAVPMDTDFEDADGSAQALGREGMDATRSESTHLGAADPSTTRTNEEMSVGATPTATTVASADSEGGDAMGTDQSDGRQGSGGILEIQSAIKALDMSPADIEAFLPECISNAIRLLEPLLQNAPEHCKVFVEQKGIEAVLRIYSLPYLPVTFGGSHTAQNMTAVLRLMVQHQAPALVKAVGGALREHVQTAVVASNQLQGRRLSDIQPEERNTIMRSLSSAECLLSLTAVLVKSTASMMQEMSSNGAEIVSEIGRLHRNVLWQLAILDETKVDQKKQTDAAAGTGGREGDDEGDGFPIRYSMSDLLRNGPNSNWGMDLEYLVPPPPGEGFGRGRGRRDHGTNAGGLGHIHHHHHGQHQHHHHHHHHPPRLGRISRHVDATHSDHLDSPGIGAGGAEQGKGRDLFGKKKTPEMQQYEMLGRLAVASRAMYSALAKAMVAPSRRRDDTVALSPLAKIVASALARVLSENLAFEGYPSLQGDGTTSTKCRYIGRILDDISTVVFDRRRTCNTAMLNTLYGYGTLKQLLATFQCTSVLLWVHPTAMEMESSKGEGPSSEERPDCGAPWLLDTLAKFARFLEQIVTASFLLTPATSAQLLVQPLPNAVRPIPKDPEAFVRAIQVEVLEVVLPLWNHEQFCKCNPAFVTSVTAIVNHAFSGTGVQGARGLSASGALPRPAPPPPDEGSVAMIVGMGFSRARAEEALQRVGTNSVEMAVEWLFSHPEEPAGEDDELARALAMSLGNVDGAPADDSSGKGEDEAKEEGPQMPLVEDILNSSMKLLQQTDAVAFPVADLLITLCNRSKGEDRPRVVTYLVDRLRLFQGQELTSPSSLSTIAHTLALVVHEDPLSREFAAGAGVTGVAIDLLTAFMGSKDDKGIDKAANLDVPKWVTALLLLLDSMLQYRSKVPDTAVASSAAGSGAGVASGSGVGVLPAVGGREAVSEAANATSADAGPSRENTEEKGHLFGEIFGSPAGYLSDEEQRKTMTICCYLLPQLLSPMAMQAVLQLCSRLTKNFSIAMHFLELKGLASLLALPKASLFPGFESVAASIIRHLLEDPQTLQQAMESEIRHTLVGLLQRNNSKVSPRQFLTALNPVMMRNPTVFMQAVAEVCQLETIGGRSVVVLSKEKERSKPNTGAVPASNTAGAPSGKAQASGSSSMAIDGGATAGPSAETTGKGHEGSKSVKGHRKVPHSFAQVIDQLLEVILYFSPPPASGEAEKHDGEGAAVTAMDVDHPGPKDKGKGKVDEGTGKEKVVQASLSADSVALAKVSFILKLMTEVLLAYSSAASVVLRRDTESSMGRGPALAGQEVFGHGGLIYHVLHRLLPFPGERKVSDAVVEEERAEKLGERAAYFVMALCMRSSEGRRRVATEVTTALASQQGPLTGPVGSVVEGSEPPRRKVRAFVDLANSLISAQVASTNAVGLSSDMIKTMVEAGMVEALTHTLQVVDLDHPDTPKFVNGVLKALEALTRSAPVAELGLRGGRTDAVLSALTAARAAARAQLEFHNRSPVLTPPPGNLLPPVQVIHREAHLPDEPMRESGQGAQEQDVAVADQHGTHEVEAVAERRVEEDVMEHDDHQRLNREMEREAHLAAEAEEAFMREAAEDVAELDDDGGGAIAYQMEHDDGDEDVTVGEEDSEDMDGEDGDDDGEDEGDEEEEEEDGEEEEDMEGDEEGLQASTPPDTDHEDNEDHAALGDDFEDDMVDEEEEDWHDDRVIELRWRDGLTGLNHVQVLGAQAGGLHGELGGPNGGDPFHSVSIDDVFGSFRRAAAADRRRGGSYRAAFNEARMRADAGRLGPFNHPLLTRPPPIATSGVGGQLGGAGGAWMREAEAMLMSGGMDVTHLYLYDGPMLADYMADGFGVLGPGAGMFGGPPPPLLDFTVDPGYLLGGRGPGMRQDGRMMAWTDDGQPQAGAQAAAFASVAEDQFVSHLRALNPAPEQPAAPSVLVGSGNAEGEQGVARNEVIIQESAPGSIPALQGEAGAPGAAVVERRVEEVAGERQEAAPARAEGGQALEELPAVVGEQRDVDTDTQMQEERAEPPSRDMEAASQDSGGSGATVGESLRSLEVEIGSADGHDESERPVGRERIGAVDVAGPPREGAQASGHERGDEDMGVASGRAAEQPRHDAVATEQGLVSADMPEDSRGRGDEAEAGPSGDGVPAGGEGTAAAADGIDPAFLEALPEDLRAEVLASQQAQARAQARAAAAPAGTSGGQGAEELEELDPEFLAALPPEIQAEVLAQQRLQRAAARAQAAVESGQPVDMDSASIIATFPAELREEVLLTSSEAVLAALPPALLAEARLLQERRALNDFQHRGLFGINNRLGARRAVGVGTGGGPGVVDRGVGGLPGRRPGSSAPGSTKVKEVEGKPMADIGALKAMIRLLRLAQPLGKNLLQRLLLNLCNHSLTRSQVLALLLDMLRPEAENVPTGGVSADGAPPSRLYGCQPNVVYGRSQQQDGIPPLVSRRVLEILTYLARHQNKMAHLLLFLNRADQDISAAEQRVSEGRDKGKAKVFEEAPLVSEKVEVKPTESPLVLLLKLLNQPLYSRSSAHLEQVMGLLEVVTRQAGQEATEARLVVKVSEAPVATTAPGVTAASPGNEAQAMVADGSAEPTAAAPAQGPEAPAGGASPPVVSQPRVEDAMAVLLSLPEKELRVLCKLLAQEGLSETAYSRIAVVLKLLADAAPPHRTLFIQELASAAWELSGPAIEELQSLGEADIVTSTSSMAGAAELRVLQALSSLITPPAKEPGKQKEGEPAEGTADDGLEVARQLNDALEPLWQGLSVCVSKIESRISAAPALAPAGGVAEGANAAAGAVGVAPPLPPGTQKVLPMVEAFFVLCSKMRGVPTQQNQLEVPVASSSEAAPMAGPEPSSGAGTPMSGTPGPSTPSSSKLVVRKDEKGMTFMRFADKHRRLLNAFIRHNPQLLEGSLSLLLKTPRLVDFDNKRSYFRARIRQQHDQPHLGSLRIHVRRNYVLEDSYNQLRMRTPDELKGRLTIQFAGEEGIDAGGLTREWYQLLSRVIFDKGALLFTTVGNESTFQPNPNSAFQTEHLSYFKFVGRVVAKALFDGQLLDVYFTRSFYKHILGAKVTYRDLEAIDPDYYKNLVWVLENDISDVLDLTFCVEADEEKHILYEKTEVTDYELIPGGRNVHVTEKNKQEYVDLIAEHRMTTAIRPQINAFLEGFQELISRDLISLFNDKELELLISGLPEIDIEDLKANTECTGYSAASPVIQWFWEVVRGFGKEDQARLLQFITGTSKVPLEGFKALQGISGPQRFQIHKAYGGPERLPSAHTCFNQLDLPDYPSKEILQERLLLAIHEANEGFGFG